MTQKWKSDATLFNAPTEQDGQQIKKKLDYDTIYRKEFLDSDPLRDWESIERCKWLWEWSLEIIGESPLEWTVLDVGTKDAQFPEFLREQGIMGIGLEYSESYVRYALNKGRPIAYGNACDMEFDDNSFDYVFSHHLHGLLPDYLIGLQEMFRVTKKYMIALNQVPGNKKKHFSYIDSQQIYYDFIDSVDCGVLYNDYLDTGFSNEWVILLKKIQPDDDYETIDQSIENIDAPSGYEPEFKVKK